MHENKDIIELLLLKYVEDNVNKEEREFLNQWIEESEDNRIRLNEFCHLYHSMDALNTLESVNTDAALSSVKARMLKPKKQSLILYLQRIAAVLFLPLLSYLIYDHVFSSNGEAMVTWRTNPGMVGQVTLPDSSKVWLNSNSSLTYSQKFASSREVHLDGEAFFEVTPDKSSRFIVQTPKKVKIEVLGTKFNVEAYKEDKLVTTTLEEGKVNLQYFDGQSFNTLVLKPGETVVYDPSTMRAAPRHVLASIVTAWKDNRIVLENTSMDELLHILRKRFDVDFIIKSPSLRDNSFTGTFDSQHLTTVLEHLRISSGINYKIIDSRSSGAHEKVEVILTD